MVKARFAAVRSGLSVFLTNDVAYIQSSRENSNHKEFTMCEGLNLSSKDYLIKWDKANFAGHDFHYCIVEI